MLEKSFDVANMGHTRAPERSRHKTERSHEENQERAYIAASRRADRSIEARVQSARMASEIHKKRTGKAFRITGEIVMKEEMYEEEDDDLPRSYRLLGPYMHAISAEVNWRVDTFLTNRVTMSQLLSASEAGWRDNEINRTFAHFFPLADRQAQYSFQRGSTSTDRIPTPPSQNGRVSSPTRQSSDPNFQPVNYGQQPSHDGYSRSLPGILPTEVKNEGATSPPPLTPSQSHPKTPQSASASVFGNVMPPSSMMEDSAFTAELPPEAEMLMGGVSPIDTFSPALCGEPQSWGSSNAQSHNYDPLKFLAKEEESELSLSGDQCNPESFETMYWGPGDATSSKNPPEEPSWDTFINDNAWSTEQQ